MENVTVESSKVSQVSVRDIIYLKSIGDYTTSYLLNGDENLVEFSLNKLQEILPSYKFFRVSDSFIINIDFLKKIKVNSNKNVLLRNGIELEIDYKRYEELKWFLRNRYCVQ